MTEDYFTMLVFLALIFFGTVSIYPIYYLLDMLRRRRHRKKEAEEQ